MHSDQMPRPRRHESESPHRESENAHMICLRRRREVLGLALAVLGTSLGLCLSALAQPVDASGDPGAAEAAYHDFEAALASYLQVESAGFDSGALHHNLGNTYFKLGDVGRSILHYERARRWMPGDENLLANLEIARSLTVDEVTPIPEFWLFRAIRWWIHLLPRGLLIGLVALGYLLAMGIVVARVLRPGLGGTWALRAAVIAAIVALTFGVNLAVRDLGIGVPAEGVVLAGEVSVHSAPADDPALLLFAIHEGTHVRIDRRSDDWVEIVLDDGKVGWVPADVLEEI